MSSDDKSIPVPGKLYRHKDMEFTFSYRPCGDKDEPLLFAKPGDVVLVLDSETHEVTTTFQRFREEKIRFLDGSGVFMCGQYNSGGWSFWWEEVEL